MLHAIKPSPRTFTKTPCCGPLQEVAAFAKDGPGRDTCFRTIIATQCKKQLHLHIHVLGMLYALAPIEPSADVDT